MSSRARPRWLRAIFAPNQLNRDEWVAALAAELPPGTRLLDVGAGTCPYRSQFRHCDYRTHDFMQLEERQLSGAYGPIDYVGDVLSIPVPDASFDGILCTEVIEHVPEPIGAIREFARILRPGGTLLLTAPLGSGLHQQPFHYYGGFTPYWYQRVFSQSGFEIVSIASNGRFYRLWAQENMRFVRYMAPWKSRRNVLLSPFWLIALPFAAILSPLLGWLADPTDMVSDFTIGYHVQARRRA